MLLVNKEQLVPEQVSSGSAVRYKSEWSFSGKESDLVRAFQWLLLVDCVCCFS